MTLTKYEIESLIIKISAGNATQEEIAKGGDLIRNLETSGAEREVFNATYHSLANSQKTVLLKNIYIEFEKRFHLLPHTADNIKSRVNGLIFLKLHGLNSPLTEYENRSLVKIMFDFFDKEKRRENEFLGFVHIWCTINDDTKVHNSILKALKNKNPDVRIAAVVMLDYNIGRGQKWALRLLIHLYHNSKDPEIKSIIINVSEEASLYIFNDQLEESDRRLQEIDKLKGLA